MATRDELIRLIAGGGAAGGAAPAPIYFASTHGVYDITQGPISSFIVPPNTYIFEASSVGEATMTNIDEPLWNMMQNRDEFAAYLLSQPQANNMTKQQLIKHLVYYKPGDTVYTRKLILEPENRFQFNWGYYKFDLGVQGIPFPESYEEEEGKDLIIPNQPGNPPLTPVMQSFRDEHFPPITAALRSFKRVETGSNGRFISETRRRESYDGPAIFIFSSCASFWPSSNSKLDSLQIVDIGRAQQVACQAFAEMGFQSGQISGIRGPSNNLLNPTLKESIALSVKTGRPGVVIESFSKLARLTSNESVTQLDAAENAFLKKVGEDNPYFVKRRFRYPQVPPGSATVFVKTGEGVRGELSYKVQPSLVTGRTWWTPQEINTHYSTSEIYVTKDGLNFERIARPAGIYTAALRQTPAPTPESHPRRGGYGRYKKSRRIRRNSKRSNKGKAKSTRKTR
jgi:hypothetical protein